VHVNLPRCSECYLPPPRLPAPTQARSRELLREAEARLAVLEAELAAATHALGEKQVPSPARPTAMKKLRIVILGFGAARQKMVL
jgi:hypothetical protein